MNRRIYYIRKDLIFSSFFLTFICKAGLTMFFNFKYFQNRDIGNQTRLRHSKSHFMFLLPAIFFKSAGFQHQTFQKIIFLIEEYRAILRKYFYRLLLCKRVFPEGVKINRSNLEKIGPVNMQVGMILYNVFFNCNNSLWDTFCVIILFYS